MIRKEDALHYHEQGRRGKIEVLPTKPLLTQRDLSLAYTPGAAEPCLRIKEAPQTAYDYTARGNLVAVVTNGSAVMGLGEIGALASKPLMEGTACLFKKFADIDVFDIEIDERDPDRLIETVASLEPTFGAISLEDIKAPECFYIEEKLRERLSIPVFHDDQHGAAIIIGAALLNAAELVDKELDALRIVICGAGAAGIATARFLCHLGVKRENVVMVDSLGVIYEGRSQGMTAQKAQFATSGAARNLDEAMVEADVFIGLSVADVLSSEMVQAMAQRPIVFAMANPNPEIGYLAAREARADAIVATGRSDCPNQVMSTLGLPAIFRGALDVQASEINIEMKVAAAQALAALAKEDVPRSVQQAYGGAKLKFGPDYIIPTPFDPRVLTWAASAVAKAAMDTGVAHKHLDPTSYRASLEGRIYGRIHLEMRRFRRQARRSQQRVVLPDSMSETALRAVQILVDERLARPVLLGNRDEIARRIERLSLEFEVSLPGIDVFQPVEHPSFEAYCEEYARIAGRRGVNMNEARQRLSSNPTYFAMMMLRQGDSDAAVLGLSTHFPEAMKPVIELIGTMPGVSRVCSMHMMVFKNDVKFFADCAVNVDPSAEEVAEIAVLAADRVRSFGVTPRVAMISFSTFGSAASEPSAAKMVRATEIVQHLRPDLEVDGEMQVDVALNFQLQRKLYPFCRLTGPANTFIFPNLAAGNACYKMLAQLGHAESVGPLLLGLNKPVEVLERSASVDDVVRMVNLATTRSDIPRARFDMSQVATDHGQGARTPVD
ncbi:MAG: NADP-dependent malic enzyme [Myxococcales bacterium]|nr:NADP-dependent malic enzyme [Myxococcales bacterium]